mgnify:CR=1 FL=1
MDKTTISFLGVIEYDRIKNTTVTTLVIDTTTNGLTTKRKHIFDNEEEIKITPGDEAYQKKVMKIITEDI